MAIEIKDGQVEETTEAEDIAEETTEADTEETEVVEDVEVVDAEEENSEAEEVSETEEEEETESDGEPKVKKGLFGKKDKRDKKDDKIDELTELLKRTMAEFDNFRKRTEKEKAAMYEIGQKSVIEKLLPIVDNFERGFSTVTEETKENDSFVNGMDMVYKQLMKSLDDLGVQAIETEGKEFDPNLHNAVMHIDDESLGENVIAQEFQKGYTFKGNVVRHSMVQVAN